MKKILTPRMLPVITVAAGVIGFLLRLWSFLGAVDDRGLLIYGHISVVLSYLLTAAFLAALFFCCRSVTSNGSYRQLFPAGPVGAAGCVIGAAGVIFACIRCDQQGVLRILLWVTGALAALSLLVLGALRFTGKRPHYLLRCLVTLFFILLLLCQYRSWIRETQFTVYFFPLLAVAFLMLTAFHGAELDAHPGDRRTFIFCNQAALFFCCLSIYGSSWLFYLPMAIWLVTGLCSVKSFKSEATEA